MMHCGNKLVTAATWLLTSLGALHLGLIGLGFNIWEQPIFRSEMMHKLIVPLHYVIGLAGLYSLIMFIQHVASGEVCKK